MRQKVVYYYQVAAFDRALPEQGLWRDCVLASVGINQKLSLVQAPLEPTSTEWGPFADTDRRRSGTICKIANEFHTDLSDRPFRCKCKFNGVFGRGNHS